MPLSTSWPKSSPFHGGVTGSNPVGGTKLDHDVMVSITDFDSVCPGSNPGGPTLHLCWNW